MGGRHVLRARQLIEGTLTGLDGGDLVRAARTVVAELGSAERLVPLVTELASGRGDPSGCAPLSYRHVLGFDKLLLVGAGAHHRLRAHVWHPGTVRAGHEDIHNHRSPLASYVVRGRLGMELYETAGDGALTAARYRESLSADVNDWLLEPAGSARLRLTQTAEYAAGSGYALSPYALHRAWCAAPGTTVTLFLETGVGRRRYTDVFTGAAAGRAERAQAYAKEPLGVAEYLEELRRLAELVGEGGRLERARPA
ncbi:hypothetical protein GCM10018785_41550 [Streptomyces longispororuber]|uniref:Uncharacterized protein n=1 Tax=Streptomyces longispororuber TaxID=68230 RepID=A0A919DRF2_9ACTN|nr:hypothetical protein [Streptomyces longispororuber]GHE68675.1 hypothetical protein GCM10018785_41550 [Streptomyces longispororuber]